MAKKTRYDLMLIGGVLLAAALLSLLFRPGGAGTWVVVTSYGEEIARYPLAEDRTVTIGEDGYNVLRIADGAAAIVEADCGDHTCVRTGEISQTGETIVCLPHRLIVRVEGARPSPFDAATQ